MNNIDNNKLQIYLSDLDDKDKHYVNTIIQNTLYISIDQMLGMIKNALSKFALLHQKYNLFIPPGKIGSEHFIISELKDILEHVVVINNYSCIDNDYPILIIDDAIYSSCNMCCHVDNLRSEGVKTDIFVVVAILSTQNVQLITDHGKYFEANVIADTVLDHLLPQNLFTDYDFKYFNTHF